MPRRTLKSVDPSDLEKAIAEAVGRLVDYKIGCAITEIAYDERDGAALTIELEDLSKEEPIGFR